MYERALTAPEVQAMVQQSGGGGGNAVPMGIPDAYTTSVNQLLSVGATAGVLANDSDPNGNSVQALLDANPRHGTLTLNSDGSFQYQPAQSYVGADEFSYRVSDGQASSGATMVTVTISSGPPSSNTTPVISGTPALTVVQDATYRFDPSAGDPDGDTLVFSIVNAPRWATFSSTTGRLEGVPRASDVGVYSDIRISVSDGETSAQLAPFAITVTALATRSVTLSWTSPTRKTDGTPLLDLAGFKVYWGRQSGSSDQSTTISNPGISTFVVENLSTGTHYFRVKAFDSAGRESDFSNETSKTIQ
jgi:VCBS repeat-containing protein